MSKPKVETALVDFQGFGQDAFMALQRMLKAFGLHLGEAEHELEEEVSDNWHLYIAKRKLTKDELKKVFYSEEDDE